MVPKAAPNIFDLFGSILKYRSWATRAARRWKFKEIEIEIDSNIEVMDILREQLSEMETYSSNTLLGDRRLTGEELIDLVYQRYGRRYDMTFAQREFLGKSFVSFNIMWQHLDQRSFPMDEDTYREKIEDVARTINGFGESEVQKIRDVLVPRQDQKSIRHPTVGRAISIVLKYDQRNFDEYFS